MKSKLSDEKMSYLKLLAESYKNVNQVSTEIINLQAILNLPKGTEHFLSDIHGEYEAFSHVLRNASGVINNYINELFGTSLMEPEKRNLATLIYYPEKKLEIIKKNCADINDWYRITLFRLVMILKRVSMKYTRSKVRKSLPPEYSYIIEELLHEGADRIHKEGYYKEIIHSIIQLDRADSFIAAISQVIQRLAIDHLHVIGDIYDRGSDAFLIMEALMNYHSVDVQWGNHDIAWMGAGAGCEALICNAIRISAKFNNLDTIEEDYGINLVPLATFAMEVYKDSEIKSWMPDIFDKLDQNQKQIELIARMHKAIAIIQFKLEAELINRHPEYEMDDRKQLDKINLAEKTITIDGKSYKMNDTSLPTITPGKEFELSPEERSVIHKLKKSFMHSLKLQEHIRFLFNKGSIYKKHNSNLLYHGSIPMSEDAGFKEARYIKGKKLSGKALLDATEQIVRKGYLAKDGSAEKQDGLDLMWYMWCGPDSPLFGKDKMTTLERYFVSDKKLHEEIKDKYFEFRNDKAACMSILENFGLCPDTSRIINGHVPVKVSKGESPIKAEGRLLVIDGGFSKAYQTVTGIAGYTLIYNSQGMMLAAHEPFRSTEDAIENETDIVSSTSYVENYPNKKKVSDTDIGKDLEERIGDLKKLLACYRDGSIKERE